MFTCLPPFMSRNRSPLIIANAIVCAFDSFTTRLKFSASSAAGTVKISDNFIERANTLTTQNVAVHTLLTSSRELEN